MRYKESRKKIFALKLLITNNIYIYVRYYQKYFTIWLYYKLIYKVIIFTKEGEPIEN